MSKKLIQAAAGAGGESVYVEDVFSTVVYSGGSAHNFEVGVDMTEGGLLWFKQRSNIQHHALFDSESDSDFNKYLKSNTTEALNNLNDTSHITVDSEGFNVANFGFGITNQSGRDYVTWAFRKQAGFFDIVSYTGNGTARSISHNLNASVGLLVVKRVDTGGNWFVLDVGTGKRGYFDFTSSAMSTANGTFFGDGSTYQAPTSTEFYISGNGNVNTNNGEYIAYLFAHDDQSFGDDEDESIIKCGSFTTDSAGVFYENLGWEPQWVLIKGTAAYGDWNILDNMRGLYGVGTANGKYLRANNSNAEGNLSSTDSEYINATGFGANGNGVTGSANAEFIYIAIRRPMKTPEAGTDVFAADFRGSTEATAAGVVSYSGFPVDLAIQLERASTSATASFIDRLRDKQWLKPDSTAAETPVVGDFDTMSGWWNGTISSDTTIMALMFKRATGFFDVVAYTGNGTAGRTVSHNLGSIPEFIIVKRRDAADEWTCYLGSLGATKWMSLNQTATPYTSSSRWNDTAPTDSVFTVGTDTSVNGNTNTYIAYLFATLAGVSKVGSYTGTGSALTVDCGFSSGARFIMIKRTDAAAGWIVFDSERGIVAGADPYIYLNATDAESSTDAIDPDSSGFIVNPVGGALNTSGGEYIFLAIA